MLVPDGVEDGRAGGEHGIFDLRDLPPDPGLNDLHCRRSPVQNEDISDGKITQFGEQ